MVGLGLIYLLSPEELRAVIAHEYGHARSGHLRLGRWIRYTLRMLVDAEMSFSWYNPARWSGAVASGVMRTIYFPWSRSREFQADRHAGELAGPQHVSSALCKVRDLAPAQTLGLQAVLAQIELTHCAPRRLVECAQGRAERVPLEIQQHLAQQQEADPLKLGGRTHPSFAARLAALARVKPPTKLPPVAKMDSHQLAILDERLTREWLSSGSVRQWCSSEEFLRVPVSFSPSGGRAGAARGETAA